MSILVINITTFQIINRDIRIFPGPALIIIVINGLAGLYYGWPRTIEKTQNEQDVARDNQIHAEQLKSIADILKEKRDKGGMTQQQLADAVLVSRQTVHRWESGKSHPDMEYMIRTAQVLDFPVNEFWGGSQDEMNDEIGDVVHRGKIYQQAAYFLLSVVIVVLTVFAVAYLGRNLHSQYFDRVNPFIKEEVGYVLVEHSGQQKAAAVDNDFSEGSIVTINGSYNNKEEFIKVIHKGAYVKKESRNVNKQDVPPNIRDNLYMISHFNDPTTGLRNLQKSYNKRSI